MEPSPERTSAIKSQLQNEANAWDNKPRYGLFSYTANHGFGVRDEAPTNNKRDETGRVKTAPKNFMGGRPQSVHGALDAFTRTGYLSMNDDYMDPTNASKLYRGNKSAHQKVHNQAFKPSGNGTKQIKAPYEYVSDPLEATRTAVSPKNFMISKAKKGYGNTTVGHLFSQNEYAVDPYENAKLMSSLERKEHWDKIGNGPFFTTFNKRDHFTSNVRLYRDPPGYAKPLKRSTTANPNVKPFLRSDIPKKGYNCTINKFPKYVEETEQEKAPVQDKSIAGPWRYNYRELTLPAPSVNNYNIMNRPRQKV